MNPIHQFRALLLASNPDPAAVSSFLNQTTQDSRLNILEALNARDQKQLWNIMNRHLPISLHDMVPPDTPMFTPITFQGINSLPAPLFSFRRFKKVFYQYNEFDFEVNGAATYGCNQQNTSWLLGTGYFQVSNNDNHKELFFDYSYLPSRKPQGFRAITSNERFPAKLSFGGLTDRVRKVSDHFLIGKATKGNITLYFTLCKDASQ